MDSSRRNISKHPPVRKTKEPSGSPHDTEISLISAFALVWRVICGRRYAIPDGDGPDVAQEAVLRLWKWSAKYKARAEGLTKREWDSFAAKTAHNEINRFLSDRKKVIEISIDEASQVAAQTPAANTEAEMVSLIANVWQEICRLSLYQRRALLLGSPELIIYLVQFCIAETEVAKSLEITKEDWREISARLPLKDREIAALARSSKTDGDAEAATRAIRKARFDARKKLGRLRK